MCYVEMGFALLSITHHAFQRWNINEKVTQFDFLSVPEICAFRCLNYSPLTFYPRRHIMFSVGPIIIKTFSEITLMKRLRSLCRLNPFSGQQQPNEERL